MLNWQVKNNLFVFFVGTNDFWIGLSGQQYTTDMIENITQSIVNNAEDLISFGAKHVIIVSPANIALMPVVQSAGVKMLL